MKTTIEEARKAIEAMNARSAWKKGVKVYASEILDTLEEYDHTPADRAECKKMMLNGADDWRAYSWGGSSLCYDSDIAATFCTPSELKRTCNGERRPNASEEWLDVQARALYQASRLVLNTLF